MVFGLGVGLLDSCIFVLPQGALHTYHISRSGCTHARLCTATCCVCGAVAAVQAAVCALGAGLSLAERVHVAAARWYSRAADAGVCVGGDRGRRVAVVMECAYGKRRSVEGVLAAVAVTGR